MVRLKIGKKNWPGPGRRKPVLNCCFDQNLHAHTFDCICLQSSHSHALTLFVSYNPWYIFREKFVGNWKERQLAPSKIGIIKVSNTNKMITMRQSPQRPSTQITIMASRLRTKTSHYETEFGRWELFSHHLPWKKKAPSKLETPRLTQEKWWCWKVCILSLCCRQERFK